MKKFNENISSLKSELEEAEQRNSVGFSLHVTKQESKVFRNFLDDVEQIMNSRNLQYIKVTKIGYKFISFISDL